VGVPDVEAAVETAGGGEQRHRQGRHQAPGSGPLTQGEQKLLKKSRNTVQQAQFLSFYHRVALPWCTHAHSVNSPGFNVFSAVIYFVRNLLWQKCRGSQKNNNNNNNKTHKNSHIFQRSVTHSKIALHQAVTIKVGVCCVQFQQSNLACIVLTVARKLKGFLDFF
jgi:hypothetical protein